MRKIHKSPEKKSPNAPGNGWARHNFTMGHRCHSPNLLSCISCNSTLIFDAFKRYNNTLGVLVVVTVAVPCLGPARNHFWSHWCPYSGFGAHMVFHGFTTLPDHGWLISVIRLELVKPCHWPRSRGVFHKRVNPRLHGRHLALVCVGKKTNEK